MTPTISERRFKATFLKKLPTHHNYDFVTGPGRSGAVAGVYASHYLSIPFIPYGQKPKGKFLIVDTATNSGRTLRKASRKYNNADCIYAFKEPPRVRFWYETIKEYLI